MSWIVSQGALGTHTVVGTPIYIDDQLVAIAVEPDWEAILEKAVQAEIDDFIKYGEEYRQARLRGEV